jgi:hypothetical protein
MTFSFELIYIIMKDTYFAYKVNILRLPDNQVPGAPLEIASPQGLRYSGIICLFFVQFVKSSRTFIGIAQVMNPFPTEFSTDFVD